MWNSRVRNETNENRTKKRNFLPLPGNEYESTILRKQGVLAD